MTESWKSFLFPPGGGSSIVSHTEQIRHYNEEENVVAYWQCVRCREGVANKINKKFFFVFCFFLNCGFGRFDCMYGI